MSVTTRVAQSADLPALMQPYREVFPDEDLVPLLVQLIPRPEVTMLLAQGEGDLLGHVAFTACGIEGAMVSVALLGPLAVRAPVRGRGIAGMLISQGITLMRALGRQCMLVLGDPRFYSRHGFRPETEVKTPYPLPDAWDGAWQSLPLGPDGPACEGRLVVPEPWRNPSLWQ